MSGPILALPYGHALSHVSRPLVLAEELRARGREVVFAGGGKELAHARRKGFEVREVEELPHETLFGRIRDRRLRFIEERELLSLVEADRRLFDEVRPSLVLTDGRISARLSTRLAGLRHAAVVNVSSTHHRAVPYAPLFDWVPGKAARALLAPFNLWFERTVFDASVPAFRNAARRLGAGAGVTATNCLEGNELTLLPDLPSFMPSRGLPEGHLYAGPLTFRSDLPDPPWWGRLLDLRAKGRPAVYFTLGTTGTRELFGSVLEGLAGSGWVAVVTTGGQVEVPGGRDDLFAADYLNGDRVMEAVDLVVCHGGNGTLYQALAHGVPVVGIPTIPDQEYNMRRAAAAGFGLVWKGALGSGFLERVAQWAARARTDARLDELRKLAVRPGPLQTALDALDRLAA